jgi:DNA-directed RNA polymerase specialized sigma24 family protein
MSQIISADDFGVRPMSDTDLVTHWIDRLRAGDPTAAQELWERYSARLIALARARLRGTPRRAADEEDVALSVFDSLCRGAGRGAFPRLGDREDLWQLLVVITRRKAGRLVAHGRRQKRGGGKVVGESALLDPAGDRAGIEQVLGSEPTPEFAAQVAEECRQLLDLLGESDLRELAMWKMEGYTNEEIAAKLGCVPRTVERKLRLIRSLWTHEVRYE